MDKDKKQFKELLLQIQNNEIKKFKSINYCNYTIIINKRLVNLKKLYCYSFKLCGELFYVIHENNEFHIVHKRGSLASTGKTFYQVFNNLYNVIQKIEKFEKYSWEKIVLKAINKDLIKRVNQNYFRLHFIYKVF
jgi:hypothetical protein